MIVLGEVELRRLGDFGAAGAAFRRRAEAALGLADLGGDGSETRRQQAADALFYGQLAQAQQAYKQGNISQALALSAPLAQQSGTQGTAAKLFRADVLRHNIDLPQAEQTLRALLNAILDATDDAARDEAMARAREVLR